MANTKSSLNSRKTVMFVVFGLLVVVLALWAVNKFLKNKSLSMYPPVAARINSEPVSTSSIWIDDVKPGSLVMLNQVKLGVDGYVEVYKDTAGKRQLIGKSEALSAGSHNDVMVKLSPAVKDGEVVVIGLTAKTGESLMDENKNLIEVLKTVGLMMQHYENEY